VSEVQEIEQAGGQPGPGDAGAADDRFEIPRLGFFQLIPKRSLAKIVMLLLVLAGIVLLQRRSATIVRQITDIVMPQPASPTRVRLAPPEAPRP
jgi:hypothetical protein